MGKSKFWKEFKEFAMKGNVMDLAVGVIIGGAFGKIVSSLVSDIIMPLLGLLLGGLNFNDLKVEKIGLNYGVFIQNVFDFIIIALSIFVFIRVINRINAKSLELVQNAKKKVAGLSGKEEAAPEPEAAAEPAPAPEPVPAVSNEKLEALLTEIRDLLKNRQE